MRHSIPSMSFQVNFTHTPDTAILPFFLFSDPQKHSLSSNSCSLMVKLGYHRRMSVNLKKPTIINRIVFHSCNTNHCATGCFDSSHFGTTCFWESWVIPSLAWQFKHKLAVYIQLFICYPKKPETAALLAGKHRTTSKISKTVASFNLWLCTASIKSI